jgi:hypothetical protein
MVPPFCCPRGTGGGKAGYARPSGGASVGSNRVERCAGGARCAGGRPLRAEPSALARDRAAAPLLRASETTRTRVRLARRRAERLHAVAMARIECHRAAVGARRPPRAHHHDATVRRRRGEADRACKELQRTRAEAGRGSQTAGGPSFRCTACPPLSTVTPSAGTRGREVTHSFENRPDRAEGGRGRLHQAATPSGALGSSSALPRPRARSSPEGLPTARDRDQAARDGVHAGDRSRSNPVRAGPGRHSMAIERCAAAIAQHETTRLQ